jgi:hypothetical protein
MSSKKVLYPLLSGALFSVFILISQGVSAQGAQALSPEELDKINQQPISKSVKNSAETGKTPPKKPSFEHKGGDGTNIKEYKESGKATEVIVESPLGNKYEMSTPTDAASPEIRNQDVKRVPTLRMPF